MPQIPRKKKVRRKARGNTRPLTLRETGHRSPALPSSAKQPSAAGAVDMLKRADYHQRILSELKRSLLVAGCVLAVLVILRFVIG